ncbi:MAG: polyhydroxyalkanoate synthesis repressor PhaR [Blastomonas sp.]
MARTQSQDADDPIIIKKYANRRLYNTQTSSYITLDFLAKLTRDGKEFQVVDAKTGDDITHNILTQIIMEEEANGQQMLPVSFLRELISMYGNSMQSMIPHYLEASMEAFRANQEKFRNAMEGSMANSPFAALARQNLAMFEAASSVFKPRKSGSGRDEQPSSGSSGEDIRDLKAQLAEMQKKIDGLASKD